MPHPQLMHHHCAKEYWNVPFLANMHLKMRKSSLSEVDCGGESGPLLESLKQGSDIFMCGKSQNSDPGAVVLPEAMVPMRV